MRSPNGGVFAMDVALSISYEPSSGSTCAILLTTSNEQLEFMLHQISELAVLALHPLLIPTLLCTYTMIILESFTSDRWSEYLRAEMASGQSGSDPFGPNNPYGLSTPMKFEDFNDLTKVILRIVQLATSYDNYFEACFKATESIQESIKYISSNTPRKRKDVSTKVGAVLGERLRYISHEGKSVFWELQSLKERTNAQMNAVNHHSTSFFPLFITMPDFGVDLQLHCPKRQPAKSIGWRRLS
jgi:hypothetical protein